MGWYRASHLFHVSAFSTEWLSVGPLSRMRSSNGGWHGLAGWGFEGRRSLRGLSQAGSGLRPDHGGNRLSPSGSSLVAANLCLAGLRPVSEFSGAEGFSDFLGNQAGRSAVRRHRRAFQADQAGRTARRRRRVPAALRTVLTFPRKTE